jgi:hypothetical protein
VTWKRVHDHGPVRIFVWPSIRRMEVSINWGPRWLKFSFTPKGVHAQFEGWLLDLR